MSNPIQLFSVTPGGANELRLPAGITDVHGVMDQLSSGVYTGLRTFHGNRFLGLEEHLDRLESSMEQMAFELQLDRDLVRRALDEVLLESSDSEDDSFVRIDVLPGDTHYPGTDSHILITRGPLQRVPEEFRAQGVAIRLAPELQRDAPTIKKADFVLTRRPYSVGTQEAYEHLMIDAEGYLLEATSSNFYGILDGELRTAPAGILAGITRRFLLFLCAGLEIDVNTTAIHREQLPQLQEAFLTSSTRGIVPVVQVEDVPIGDGLPGPRTKSLMRSYGVLCHRAPQRAYSSPA